MRTHGAKQVVVLEELDKIRRLRTEADVWTDHMLMALVKGVKGKKWFSLIDKVYRPRTLETAWEAVRRNGGAAGVDKLSVERFEVKAGEYLEELGEGIKTGKYVPMPVRRKEIPKEKGKTRPLGIPTVKDRIVQKATLMVIEPIFENEFLDMSYGFRPGRGAREALRKVDEHIGKGYTHVVDADIKGYFDNIPHDKLMARVGERIADGRIMELLWGWLNQDIMTEVETWKPTVGTPQGAVISPLLANIYLHPLDCLMTSNGFEMVRYADDFVILCKDADRAKEALSMIERWVAENGLTLHPDKIHVGDCTVEGEGFDFLGYRFEAGKKHVRQKSMLKLRERIRGLTKRSNGDSLAEIIRKVNVVLRGWYNYFKLVDTYYFKAIDGFIRRRMRAILLKRNKGRGFGKSHAIHSRWPNSFFEAEGYKPLVKRYVDDHANRLF
jgi:RNA-directed DNA polymerase